VFPLFAEGALSPADEVLDLVVAAVLVRLLGWHWEFLPAFVAELVPGVGLVPFCTLAVINVYRKWKQITITTPETREQRPALKGQVQFFPSGRDSSRRQDGRFNVEILDPDKFQRPNGSEGSLDFQEFHATSSSRSRRSQSARFSSSRRCEFFTCGRARMAA